MTHLEGPIVDSFYDLSVNCWFNAFHPPLPQINEPAASGKIPSFEKPTHNSMFDENGILKDLTGQPLPKVGSDEDHQANDHSVGFAGLSDKDTKETTQGGNLAQVTEKGNQTRLVEHTGDDPHFDDDIAGEVLRAQSVLSPKEGETRMQAVTRHLSNELVAA